MWLPGWPLQRLTSERPELKTRALVTYIAPGRGTARVGLCSAAARRRGVLPGMPLAEATALATQPGMADDSPQPLHIEPPDRAALAALATACQRFSPTVGWEEPPADDDPLASPDTLLLDISGSAHLFGGEEKLARRVRAGFARRGLRAHVAVADTIGAAWACAHAAGWQAATEETTRRAGTALLGKPAVAPESGFETTSSAVVVPPGESAAALAELPVAALRLPARTLALLTELGLARVEQLLSLPRQAIPARLGSEIGLRLDQALGLSREVIVCRALLPPLEADCSFEPLAARAPLLVVLGDLLRQLTRMLDERRHGIQSLDCRLYLEDGLVVSVPLGLVQPRANAAYLRSLLELRFEQVQFAAPVSALRLRVVVSAPLVHRQQELFATDLARDRQRHLAELLDQLTSRLGGDNVVRVRLVSDAQPEQVCRYEPVLGSGPAASKPQKRAAEKGTQLLYRPQKRGRNSYIEKELRPLFGRQRKRTQEPQRAAPVTFRRPLRLARRPLAIEAWSVVPDGPLWRFRWRGGEERVARSWGPERIETGWWRGRAVRRDYYQIETTTGQRYWLFRRLDDRRWFLHGWFE